MRKMIFFTCSIMTIAMLTACSGGRSAMADNENLGKILSQTASKSTEEVVDTTPAVDKLSDQNSADEDVTYFKLKTRMNTYVDAGDYAISMAKDDCSVTAYDSAGNPVGSITISKDKSDSPIPHVGNLSVPEGGYLMSTADCVAMKK